MDIYPIQSDIDVAVSGATNANPIVVTTSSAHTLVNGELVTITGVKGNLNANVTNAAVSSVTSTTFTLSGHAGSGLYSGGGSVRISGARDRDFAAGTAATGTVYSFPGSTPAGRLNFYVDCASDPSGVNKEVDVALYGRVTSNSDWFLVAQITETTAGWARVGSGRYVNKSLDLPIHPELRMDVVVSASSTNTVQGWIVV